MRGERYPADSWQKRRGGTNPGEIHKRWLRFDIGRWQIGIGKQFNGDAFGQIGADSWSIEIQLVRNPVAPHPQQRVK